MIRHRQLISLANRRTMLPNIKSVVLIVRGFAQASEPQRLGKSFYLLDEPVAPTKTL